MSGYVVEVRVNGEINATEMRQPPGLTYLQNLVGGPIQLIPNFDKFTGHECIAYCNEEGKLMGNQPVNRKATAMWHALGGDKNDAIVGTVVILHGDEKFMEEL